MSIISLVLHIFVSSLRLKHHMRLIQRALDSLGLEDYLSNSCCPVFRQELKKVFFFITRVYGRRIHGSGSEGANAGACNLVPTENMYQSTTDQLPLT